MRNVLLGAALLAGLAGPAFAKNFAVPANNPALTLSIPDKWKPDEIQYGYGAKSPDGDVFFSVEYASKSRFDRMMKENEKWMRENEIDDKVEPTEKDVDFNGKPGKLFRFDTTDGNGKTIVDFIVVKGNDNTAILITLWASEEERQANKADINAIMGSIRPIQ
jgi:hypothetical protein